MTKHRHSTLFILAMIWGMGGIVTPFHPATDRANLVRAEESTVKTVRLTPNDRVVFLGDSITQQGAGPGGYVTLVREALAKHPSTKGVEVIGAGISGNRVPDLEKRLERDVLSKKPDVVVIYIGINDVWHLTKGRGTSKEDYAAGLNRLLNQLKEADARVILCTASVIGEKTDGGNPLDETLEEYVAISRRIAREQDVQLLDLRKKFLGYLKEHHTEGTSKNLLTTDGVHLNAEGNRFVAAQMLAALGAEQTEPAAKPGRVLRHVVLFQFKDQVTKAEIQEVVDAFGTLPKKIPAIKEFEWGTDVSVENKAAGFTHGFIVSFASTEGRDAYLPHPAHQEFVKLVGPRIENVLVFDFWAEK